ncbi:tape measure protein, partial [Nostoc sp.]
GSAGKSLARGIEKGLNSYKFSNSSFKAAGEAIASGLVAGMKSGDNQVKASASRMAGLVIDETRTKLKIHSPSKVFEEIGSEIVAGLSAGLGAGGALSISSFIQGIINDAKSAVGAGLAFAGDSVKKYSDFKAVEAQLTSLTGSTAKATDSLKFLRAEADKLALPFLDSTKAYASLVAATNGTKLAPVTKDIFDGFSSGARAAQLSTADFNGAFLGLVQSITRGTQSTADFRQISSRIPQAMSVAAKSIGVTNAEFQKLLESGQLTASVFIPAFTKALGEASTTTLATATDTSTASLTRLNNRLDEVKIALGAAIEPGVVAGLNFAQTALSELGKSGTFDDLNQGAKAFAAYLRENPQYAKATAEAIRGVLKDAIANTVSLAGKLAEYLQKNPTAIKDAGSALVSFGRGISDAVAFATNLLGIFKSIATTVDEAYTKASKLLGGDSQGQDRFKNFLRFGPASLIPGLFPSNEESTPKTTPTPGQQMAGIVQRQGLRIVDSNDSKPIHNYSDITRHHANRGVESDRDYDNVGGRQEEIRRLRDGLELVKKDIVLENANGSTDNVMVPAPVSGYARTSKDYGKFALYDKPTGGNLLGQVLHLDPSSFQFKDGQYVNYGESIGKEGGTGANGKLNAFGTHAHVELVIAQWRKYIQDLQTGVFDATAQATKSTPEQVKKKLNLSASDGWMRTVASTYGAGDGTDGTLTASGRRFNKNELTAAINENLKRNLGVAWGDRVEFLNSANNKTVVASITDSGPYEKKNGRYVPHSTRGFDLSTAAANQIGISLGEIAFRVLGKNTTQSQAIAQAQSTTATGATTGLGQQPPEIRAILEGQRLKQSAEDRQKLREAAQATMQSTRGLEDLEYSSIKNPSLSDRQAEEARKEQQKYDDSIREATQRREDAASRIGISSAKLSSGSTNEEEARDLQLQIALDKRSVAELDSVIQHLSSSRATAAKNLAQYQAEQRNIRARGVNFDSRANDISILGGQVTGLKDLQSLSPTDTRLDALPSLERELALKQTQLDLDRK